MLIELQMELRREREKRETVEEDAQQVEDVVDRAINYRTIQRTKANVHLDRIEKRRTDDG